VRRCGVSRAVIEAVLVHLQRASIVVLLWVGTQTLESRDEESIDASDIVNALPEHWRSRASV